MLIGIDVVPRWMGSTQIACDPGTGAAVLPRGGHTLGRGTQNCNQNCGESMARTSVLIVCAVVAALLGSACELITGTQGKRVVGVLEWGPYTVRTSSVPASATLARTDPDLPRLLAPDTVQAGVPFTVTITTIGLRVCWKEAGAEVELRQNLAIVTPYDFTPETKDGYCADTTVLLRRDVELRFDTEGEAVIRVAGRKVTGADLERGTPITVEKRIVVK